MFYEKPTAKLIYPQRTDVITTSGGEKELDDPNVDSGGWTGGWKRTRQ